MRCRGCRAFFGLFDGTGWFNHEVDGERIMPFWSSLVEATCATANFPTYAPKRSPWMSSLTYSSTSWQRSKSGLP